MDDQVGAEVEVISDGEGLAVIGDAAAVDRFVSGLGVESRDLGLSRLHSSLFSGAAAAQIFAAVSANSGRWIKLTKESAERVKQAGLMDSKTPGIKHVMVGEPGKIKNWLQTTDSITSNLNNPAMLSNTAALMAQVAMQQAVDEITDYLKRIDEKLDDVLRTQVNAVLAELDAADLAIREAMTVRESVGRVSEVSWSKVQSLSSTILTTQAFALRQLGDMTAKVEQKAKIDELMKRSHEIESDAHKWLAVLARSFQLQDAMAVLELDRVFETTPDELDRHRLALKTARDDRLELIADATEQLLNRIQDAAERANSRVLFNPIQSPAVVKSTNSVATDVHGLQSALGIEAGQQSSDIARWRDAAAEGLGRVKDVSGEGVATVKNLGGKTRGQAAAVKDKLIGRIGERKQRRNERTDSSIESAEDPD